MPNIRIQLALENNVAELLPLVRAYHTFEGFNLSEKVREEAVRKLLCDRSLGGIWLIYNGLELVGYITLCVGFSLEFAGLDGFVDEFYIHPPFRGKGMGTKVLVLIKAEAKKMNIQALHLEVARKNVQAQALYAKADFKTREKYVLMSVNL